MKSSTSERIDRMVAAAGSTRFSENDLRELFLSELRQQDRDTRHACAEACAVLSENILKRTTSPIVTLQCAHQACMNTYSI